MKNVLLLVHDDEGQEVRLQAALNMTRGLDGHLTCLDVSLYPPFVGDYYGGTGEAVLLAQEREKEEKNRGVLTARLENEDVAFNWIDMTGNFADAILDCATLADIVVLSQRLDQFAYPDMRQVVSKILTHARIPVLAVPTNIESMSLDRALITWDGQLSCAATVRCCVPMLKLAGTVEIFTVRDGTPGIDPFEAATYLSRHGIHADVRAIDNGLYPADRHILEEADVFGADYILMGAYSHGRIMETFGGVTKRLLANAKQPLILGH